MGDRRLQRLKAAGQEAELRLRTPPAPTPAPEAPASPRTGDVERFAVWFRLRFPSLAFLGPIPIVLTGALVLGLLAAAADDAANRPIYLVFSVVALAPVILPIVLSYGPFRRWRAGVPFRVHGWERVVDRELLLEGWFRCRLKVDATGDAPSDVPELVRAALHVFAERANARFYSTDGDDERKRWRVEGTTVSGHANPAVAWRLYLLCAGDLALVARERGGIASVTFGASPGNEYVSSPSIDERA